MLFRGEQRIFDALLRAGVSKGFGIRPQSKVGTGDAIRQWLLGEFGQSRVWKRNSQRPLTLRAITSRSCPSKGTRNHFAPAGGCHVPCLLYVQTHWVKSDKERCHGDD